MDTWQIILSVMAGVGLSAACGFRIFIPPLIIAIAAKAGHVNLGTEFAWMGSDIALVAFGLAAVLEVGAYYIPWLDNALDTIAAPVAVVAGTITSAAVFGDMSPWLKWTLAAIAGGGAAGAVQITTTVTRGHGELGDFHRRGHWLHLHRCACDCDSGFGVFTVRPLCRISCLEKSGQTLPQLARPQRSPARAAFACGFLIDLVA